MKLSSLFIKLFSVLSSAVEILSLLYHTVRKSVISAAVKLKELFLSIKNN